MVGETQDALIPFDQSIVRHCALSRWNEHFVPEMLSWLPELMIELVLGPFRIDEEKAAKLLKSLRGVKFYHAGLVEWMLSKPSLAELIPTVFAACLDTFPADALQRCVSSVHIDHHTLLMRLATSGNPMHLSVHRQLIQKTLQRPINLDSYRFLASMLKSHTRYDLIELLKNTVSLSDDTAVWFVREVEVARGERLIDEAAHFRM